MADVPRKIVTPDLFRGPPYRRHRQMRGDAIFVYILASGYNGTLYVGVTSDLLARIVQHRLGTYDGHTKRYGIKRLVYFEPAATLDSAFVRERQLKKYRRDWKRNLIERNNPAWNDLAAGFGLAPLAASNDGEVDPGTRPG